VPTIADPGRLSFGWVGHRVDNRFRIDEKPCPSFGSYCVMNYSNQTIKKLKNTISFLWDFLIACLSGVVNLIFQKFFSLGILFKFLHF